MKGNKIVLSVILVLAIAVFFGGYYMMNNVMVMFQPDRFVDNLQIPDNIELHLPKGQRYGDGYTEIDTLNLKTEPDFELYNSTMPGFYEFVLWTGRIENGVAYLKAYEITGEHPLSVNQIPQESAIKIFNPEGEISKFGPSSFTIREGDWDKFYAVRFEVWFLPDAPGKAEKKLMEKIYKIEGYSN